MIGLIIIGIGAIAGIMLGLRFKILILVPAILLATAAITVTGIVSGYEAKPVALTVFGTATSLQIGYIAGCILDVVVLALLPARTATTTAAPGSLRALSLARLSLARSSARQVPP